MNYSSIAMLDYYLVTSLSAKLSEAEPFKNVYCEWVAMYNLKALDGQQDRIKLEAGAS